VNPLPIFRGTAPAVGATVRAVGLNLAAAFLIGAVCAAEPTSFERAMQLAGEGIAAADGGNAATYEAKLEEAVALRPDMPRLLAHLAEAQLRNDRASDAAQTLARLAAMGLANPIDEPDDLARLRAQNGFAELAKQFSANGRAVGKGEMAFALRDMTGLIEGIAWNAAPGEFYFGDVHARAVWARTVAGKVRRLTPESDDLLGVFGLTSDAERGALWAATAAVPAMRGYAPELQGTAALVEIDVASGAVRRAFPVPVGAGGNARHVLGHVALASDGAVLALDRGEPALWRLAPGSDTLERWVVSPEFVSPRGLAVLGPEAAVVSDRLNGLIFVDLAARDARVLAPPADTTLVGIEGLVIAADGSVIALQGDTRPTRVLRIELENGGAGVARVTVLESAHLTLAAPGHGCAGPGGEIYFVGNGGWSRFDADDGKPTEPRPVPVFKTR